MKYTWFEISFLTIVGLSIIEILYIVAKTNAIYIIK